VLLNQGRYEEGARHAERRYALSRDSGDPIREGEGETGLAMVRALTSRLDEALPLFATGIAKLRAAGVNTRSIVSALGNYGLTLARLGRREESIAAYAESARLARGLGNSFDEANSLGFMATHLRVIGRLDEARPHLQRALELAVGSGNRFIEFGVHFCLGAQLDAEGRAAEGLAAYERSAAIAQEVGNVPGVIFARRIAANLFGRLGDRARASDCAVAVAAAAKDTAWEYASLLVDWTVARWPPPGCEPDLDAMRRAERRLHELGRDETSVALLIDSGRLEWSRGRMAETQADMSEAREMALRLDNRDALIVCDAYLAALGRGDAREVARRVAANWSGFSLWTRIEVSGLVAHASGASELLARARGEVESAVLWAPPECRSTVRTRLERQIEGAVA
jgi:tetratricopeptide (TPR) repeat protein